MFVFLVTGVSGAGKSTLARCMTGWGHRTVSADGDPLLSAWTDPAGHPAKRPAHPDAAWLARHEWRFSSAGGVSG
jgi:adenylate kinase family enzyme